MTHAMRALALALVLGLDVVAGCRSHAQPQAPQPDQLGQSTASGPATPVAMPANDGTPEGVTVPLSGGRKPGSSEAGEPGPSEPPSPE